MEYDIYIIKYEHVSGIPQVLEDMTYYAGINSDMLLYFSDMVVMCPAESNDPEIIKFKKTNGNILNVGTISIDYEFRVFFTTTDFKKKLKDMDRFSFDHYTTFIEIGKDIEFACVETGYLVMFKLQMLNFLL